MLLVFFLLQVSPLLCLARPRWNEIKRREWDEPQGRTFEVSDQDDIRDLQGELRPGDAMIMLANGNWDGPNRIHLNASGEAGAGRKIYLIAEEYGAVELTSKVQIVFSGQYQEVRGVSIVGEGDLDGIVTPVFFEPWSEHCRFTDSLIKDYNRAVHDKQHHWVEIWGGFHTIDYNSFVEKKEDGMIVRVRTENGDFKPPGAQPDSHDHYIGHNFFGPRLQTPGGDDGEGVQIGLRESEFMMTNTIVEFNLFEEYDAEIECVSVKGTNNTVRYNTLRNSACTVNLRHSDDSHVEHNYFYCGEKDRCGGPRVGGGDDHTVINNYIEDNEYSSGIVSAVTVHAAPPNDPYERRVVRRAEIRRNVMLNSRKHALAAGFQDSSGAQTEMPIDTRYIENVMTARGSDDDFCVREYGTHDNPTWERNTVWIGKVDAESDTNGGIVEQDPELQYDDDYEIMKPNPSVVGFDFQMAHPPLHEDDDIVGVTWDY